MAWLSAALVLGLMVAPVGAKGPKCADIQSSNGLQDSRAAFDVENAEASGVFFLEGTSCSNITYTLVILDNANSASPVATGSVQGDGTEAFVEITVTGLGSVTDNDVCAYVTTSRGKNVFDRGPAEGCVLLLGGDESGGGGKGF